MNAAGCFTDMRRRMLGRHSGLRGWYSGLHGWHSGLHGWHSVTRKLISLPLFYFF